MPRPHDFTPEMERERDELVEALEREGVTPGRTGEERRRPPRERAFAIATAQVRQKHSSMNPSLAYYDIEYRRHDRPEEHLVMRVLAHTVEEATAKARKQLGRDVSLDRVVRQG